MKYLACGLLIAVAACATVAGAPSSGTFGDVRMSAETGDQGGFQMETRLDGPKPSVVFTTCEGGCYGGESWPVAISGDVMTFSVVDDWYAGDGELAEQDTTRYVARWSGDGWLLTSPDSPGLNARLRRLPDAAPGDTEELAHF